MNFNEKLTAAVEEYDEEHIRVVRSEASLV